MKKLIGSVAMLLLAGVPIAATATSIVIDFEGFAYGTSVGNYYNHGKDSLNRVGSDYYGISFGGGTIKATPRGNYLTGTTLTIDPAAVRAILGTEKYYITFNAGVYYQQDYRTVYVTFEDGFYEPNAYIPGNDSPDCRQGGCGIYYGTMGAYRIGNFGGDAMPIRISIPADRLDNVQIHSWNGSGSMVSAQPIFGTYELDRDIPEPASLALFGIGAAGILTRRYRNGRQASAGLR